MTVSGFQNFIALLEEMHIEKILISSFGVMLGAIGTVYAFGRMLGLANSNRSRNLVGILMMFLLSFCFTLRQHPDYQSDLKTFFCCADLFIFFTDMVYKVLIACIFYVLIGFSLYSRVDRLLDRRVGADNRSQDSCPEKPAPKKSR